MNMICSVLITFQVGYGQISTESKDLVGVLLDTTPEYYIVDFSNSVSKLRDVLGNYSYVTIKQSECMRLLPKKSDRVDIILQPSL